MVEWHLLVGDACNPWAFDVLVIQSQTFQPTPTPSFTAFSLFNSTASCTKLRCKPCLTRLERPYKLSLISSSKPIRKNDSPNALAVNWNYTSRLRIKATEGQTGEIEKGLKQFLNADNSQRWWAYNEHETLLNIKMTSFIPTIEVEGL